MFKNFIFLGLFVMIFSACAVKNQNFESVKSLNAQKFGGLWYEIANYKGNRAESEKIYEFLISNNEATAIKSVMQKDKQSVKTQNLEFVGGVIKGLNGKSYKVVQIEPNYEYALLFSSDGKDSLILSRTKKIPEILQKLYFKKAKSAGFEPINFVLVRHN